MIKCVIFDFDGTLVDSEALCNQAFLDLIPSITAPIDDLVQRYSVSDPKSTLLSELATRANMCSLSPANNTPCHRSSHPSVAKLSGKTTFTPGRTVD